MSRDSRPELCATAGHSRAPSKEGQQAAQAAANTMVHASAPRSHGPGCTCKARESLRRMATPDVPPHLCKHRCTRLPRSSDHGRHPAQLSFTFRCAPPAVPAPTSQPLALSRPALFPRPPARILAAPPETTPAASSALSAARRGRTRQRQGRRAMRSRREVGGEEAAAVPGPPCCCCPDVR